MKHTAALFASSYAGFCFAHTLQNVIGIQLLVGVCAAQKEHDLSRRMRLCVFQCASFHMRHAAAHAGIVARAARALRTHAQPLNELVWQVRVRAGCCCRIYYNAIGYLSQTRTRDQHCADRVQPTVQLTALQRKMTAAESNTETAVVLYKIKEYQFEGILAKGHYSGVWHVKIKWNDGTVSWEPKDNVTDKAYLIKHFDMLPTYPTWLVHHEMGWSILT